VGEYQLQNKKSANFCKKMLAICGKVCYHIQAPVKVLKVIFQIGGAMKWLSVIFAARA
jgi:hypothetical protein